VLGYSLAALHDRLVRDPYAAPATDTPSQKVPALRRTDRVIVVILVSIAGAVLGSFVGGPFITPETEAESLDLLVASVVCSPLLVPMHGGILAPLFFTKGMLFSGGAFVFLLAAGGLVFWPFYAWLILRCVRTHGVRYPMALWAWTFAGYFGLAARLWLAMGV
jgi:hypothetical protein